MIKRQASPRDTRSRNQLSSEHNNFDILKSQEQKFISKDITSLPHKNGKWPMQANRKPWAKPVKNVDWLQHRRFNKFHPILIYNQIQKLVTILHKP